MDKYEILQWFPLVLILLTILINVIIVKFFNIKEIQYEKPSENFEGIFGVCAISTFISTIITVGLMVIIEIFL